MKVIDYGVYLYPELERWWTAHGWDAIPSFMLPELGWVVECEDKFLCAGFVYHDKSTPLAQMEWIVSNPDNTPRESLKSISMLIKHISDYADENTLALFTSVENKGLIKLYERNGFSVSESGMTNMLRFS